VAEIWGAGISQRRPSLTWLERLTSNQGLSWLGLVDRPDRKALTPADREVLHPQSRWRCLYGDKEDQSFIEQA
jgi:hypothetical protein